MREEVIRQVLLRLQVRGGYRTRDWVQYHCPFAEHTHMTGTDRNASFGVKVDDRRSSHYYCFTCKKAGPLSNLPLDLSLLEEAPYDPHAEMIEIIRAETERGFGLFEEVVSPDELGDPLNDHLYMGMYENLRHYPDAMAYLEQRGISEWAMDYLEMKYDPDESRIVFPVRDINGGLHGFTGRTILPEELWPPRNYHKSKDYFGLPKKHLLLNADKYQPGQRIALVEGPMDVARIASISEPEWGICPVGLLGSGLFPSKRGILTELGAPTFLMFDNDEAGDLGLYGGDRSQGAIDLLIHEIPIYVPMYPEGVGDPGELDHDQFAQMINETPMEAIR